MDKIIKEKEENTCEKCGEETGILAVGDESYDYCKKCNWTTHY